MTIEANSNRRQELTEPYSEISTFRAIRDVWTALRSHAERRRAERAAIAMDPRLVRDISIDHGKIMLTVYSPPYKRGY